MIFGPAFAAGLLAAASVQSPSPPARPAASIEIRAVTPAGPAPEAPSAPSGPAAGDPAPDFTYQSREYLWQNLHNMLEQGSVLLVFGAPETQLRALERERDGLVAAGVLPVAVVHRRDGDVWSIVRRNGLTYSLLADPHGVIAGQFGFGDPASHDGGTVWFVIDRAGRIRERGDGPPRTGGWTATAAAALGLSDVRAAGAH